jgi:ATP-binding cassette, subfamily B, bacterial
MSFPFYRQLDSMDCGPTCLRMVSKYFGRNVSLQLLRQKCEIQRSGVSLWGICEAAESIGLKTMPLKLDYNSLRKDGCLPCIVHWNQKHFVVVYKINRLSVWIADPARSKIKLTKREFEEKWLVSDNEKEPFGIALIIDPTPAFFELDEDDKRDRKSKPGSANILRHFTKHRKLFIQLSLITLLGIILQATLPFFSQLIVDTGIGNRDLHFITLLLAGQIMILSGSLIVDFLKSWVLLYISTRVNISLLAEFFTKLMKLPMSYFDVKMTGDIMQRMTDHQRLQNFITNTFLNTSFSIVNFLVFTFIVIAYDVRIFGIFLLGSLAYFGWMLLFLKQRRKIDFTQFELSAKNQNATIEMIQGMQEIKLSNAEVHKRWGWEHLQSKIFKQKMRSLHVNQFQSAGAQFINHGKNILITFLTAREVIYGNISLGEMVAIQFIVGQLNGPLSQMVQFFQSYQDAKISLERINEIQQLEDEEPANQELLYELPANQTLHLKNIGYKYPGFGNDYALQDINLEIPQGKTTAIVGTSGSGKTTLIKLLLKYYPLTQGDIRIGGQRFKNIGPSFWRSKCGVITQEGFIFSDTISSNIAVGEQFPDQKKLRKAITIANLQDFVDSLPLGVATKIGAQGNGISQGQKQRVLIARAVYKNPEFIFLDEATSCLDASNELIIMNNLQEFFKGKTVVIAAHRLSTVKNADQIVVLEKGVIVEKGTHAELTEQKRNYFQLVKNQLESTN